MRWDALFADLEARLEHEERLALEEEIPERVRIEVGAQSLVDRLRAHVGSRLVLHVGGQALRGQVRDVGADFVVLTDEPGGRSLVPVAGLQGVEGLGRSVAPPAGAVLRRLGLRSALRGLLVERAEVRVVTAHAEVRGLLSRVGADHVDLVPADGGRADGQRPAGRCVPLPAVLAVRSRD